MTTALDWHIGKQITRQRKLQNMRQQDLADAVGLTFQCLSKYECGAVHIPAHRLWGISCALCVPVGFFFEGLSVEIAA